MPNERKVRLIALTRRLLRNRVVALLAATTLFTSSDDHTKATEDNRADEADLNERPALDNQSIGRFVDSPWPEVNNSHPRDDHNPCGQKPPRRAEKKLCKLTHDNELRCRKKSKTPCIKIIFK